MKYSFLLCFFLFAGLLTAQSAKVTNEQVAAAAAEVTAIYNLDADQQIAIVKIERTRLENLAAIAPLQTKDKVKYYAKRKSSHIGEQNSIERILNTTEQRAIFQQRKTAARIAESDRIKELRAQGHNGDAIRVRLLESY